MKIDVRSIILLFLCLLSSYSNSEDLHFNWKLEQQGSLLLSGTATSSTHTRHSNARGYTEDEPSLTCALFLVDNFADYKVISFTNIEFNQNNLHNLVPDFFNGLLGSGRHNLKHSFETHYTLRGQTTTTAYTIAEVLYCMFCPICFRTNPLIFENTANNEERVRALETATPNQMPEYVTIDNRSITHTSVTNDRQMLLLSSTEAIDDNTHIFDLFLNTPEAQKWIIEHLSPTTDMVLELLIPELFNTAIPATILVQEQSGENDSEDDSTCLQPTHFVSLYLLNGPSVKYHLKKLSTNNIQVLAIMVSIHYYTLTLTVDNYDVIANEPPPHYAELYESCHCNGACNCANSRNNRTDGSDNQVGTTFSSHMFFPRTH
ncbi:MULTISPECIES: hypothetical protein [unclassified Endozoicomonas]|uniref:hypothetical protein n=1 Tax=unclassified Endozoicomonas TaxID=2644528 RepID=UPI002147EE17|nr:MULTISPECIES: hypothetical protein [unclassified Endozoicomonas]